jgi:hypothetical protein
VTSIVGGCGAMVRPQTGSSFLQHNYKTGETSDQLQHASTQAAYTQQSVEHE